MLFRGGLADKVKRTVIFHFIETLARSVPLFLLLSLHVSLISSLQATQIPSLLHILTIFPHWPQMPSFPPSNSATARLFVNTELTLQLL